jgi:hypothetical protein
VKIDSSDGRLVLAVSHGTTARIDIRREPAGEHRCGDAFSFSEIAGWLRDADFVSPRRLTVPGPSPLTVANKPAS